MFEDCFVTPEKRSRPAPEKLIGIALSVLVHGLLVYGIIQARFTVKIVPLRKEEVRSVVISPPLKVSIPKIVGGRAAGGVPEGLPEEEPFLESGLAEVPGAPGTLPGPVTTVAPAAPPGPEAGVREDAPPGATAVPSLSSRFRESLTLSRRPGEDRGLSITLAPPGTPPGPPGGSAGPVTGPLPDFSKYIPGPLEGLGTGGGGGRRGGRAAGGQRIGVSIPLKGYDLTPWAVKVVDRLQRYWDLPAAAAIAGEAAIKIIVVIKKSGELDSIEILERSVAEALDLGALQALRSSLPFPSLPDDFPGDFLEIQFDFSWVLQ